MSAKYGTITTYGERLISEAETLVALGSRSKTLVRDYRQRLEGHCKPFFGSQSVRSINTPRLKEFVAYLAAKGLKATSIHAILSFVSMTLKVAVDDGVLKAVPRMPRPSAKDNPRPWFSRQEYKQLLQTLRRLERASTPVVVRRWPITKELRSFCTFMVNSFLRPADVFALKHSNCEIVQRPDGIRYVKITLPSSKAANYPVITMPAAVEIYRRLKADHEKDGYGKSSDYVFLPQYQSRSYAQEIIRRQFGYVLGEADLKTTGAGAERTTYSLRHTAIMFRLINNEGLDLLTLARNCRTSVEMIDRFYAKHLDAEMNVAKLQSMKFPSRYGKSLS
ncbi:tyrosine-type recombinase/integrase [Phenylobacterium sp.]|uniref:tyrosine-type recombinase/integrase n=1 Tax=Phenylobacterium sp. TaxID=1871053 RepID=UPI0035B2CFBC